MILGMWLVIVVCSFLLTIKHNDFLVLGSVLLIDLYSSKRKTNA